jgi:hypothetical protein
VFYKCLSLCQIIRIITYITILFNLISILLTYMLLYFILFYFYIVFLYAAISYSFNHSFCMCRIRRSLAVLRSFFPSSLLRSFSCHPSPPTIIRSPHLAIYFLVYLSVLLFPNSYIIILFWEFYSILFTCPHKRNQFNLIVSIIVGFLTLA